MAKKPPKAYKDFVATYPRLEESWDKAREQEAEGPLDEKSRRLIKLGIAVGAMRQGAVSSSARKARAAGATEAEIQQIVGLAASTLGFPATVAVFTWIRDA